MPVHDSTSGTMHDFAYFTWMGDLTASGVLPAGRSEFGLLLNLEQIKYDERMKLLAYSDSEWAGQHGSRKSASSDSSGCLVIDGILLYSSSRTQGLIALSSAEAEVYAAVGTCCDAIYMKRCLEFVFEQTVSIQPLIDNSAARQILMRAGVWTSTASLSEDPLASTAGGKEDGISSSSDIKCQHC